MCARNFVSKKLLKDHTMFSGYLIASWKIIKVVSCTPLAFLFFTWTLLPESPRWLVSKGRTKEATAILRKMAETNNVIPPADLAARVEKLSESTKEQSMGYFSLFGSSVLAIRTILMTIGFTASAFVYYQVTLSLWQFFIHCQTLLILDGHQCLQHGGQHIP